MGKRLCRLRLLSALVWFRVGKERIAARPWRAGRLSGSGIEVQRQFGSSRFGVFLVFQLRCFPPFKNRLSGCSNPHSTVWKRSAKEPGEDVWIPGQEEHPPHYSESPAVWMQAELYDLGVIRRVAFGFEWCGPAGVDAGCQRGGFCPCAATQI